MIDFTKIPKTAIWAAIAAFVILVLYLLYSIISYKVFKPYQRFLEIDCSYENNTAIIIITAKKAIFNITVSDFSGENKCHIDFINEGSMDACKIDAEKIGSKVYVKFMFNVDNKTYKAISECKVLERKSLLDLILRR